jgi:lysophospholipase L1-like esterase
MLDFLRDPWQHKKTILVVTLAVFTIFVRERRSLAHSINVGDDHNFGIQVHPQHRCFDADDPKEWKKKQGATVCLCTDPLAATPRNDLPVWQQHHKELADAATEATRDSQRHKLDLIMIGDSIIERWNGTRSMGQRLADEFLPIFDQLFTRHGGGRIDAIALGSSGDTSNNLLWQLNHGILNNDLLDPPVWLIMVGTNDLGRTKCSKRNALAGILHVAQYLREKRPKAKIVIHGLFPRSDDDPGEGETPQLGLYWQQILFINKELKKLCNLHEEWTYMDAPNLFLRRIHGGRLGAVEINPETMPDGLHPNIEGYTHWGAEIVKVVDHLL